ncbi:MAG: [Eubacterium sp.]|nr:[FeFe] hydrogenase H-cluster radical SAM maturase HydE [Eubacterium sp.]
MERNDALWRTAQKLIKNHTLTGDEYELLLGGQDDPEITALLREEALRLRRKYYGDKIYIRGLIEFTNYCRNNCLYCGIRRDNRQVTRYRLAEEEILACCENGYELGYRTFVLQGGEDSYYNDDRMEGIVAAIHEKYPDCAITLSLGERSRESYERLFLAGAARYLLRHETADEDHYRMLHPEEMSLSRRKKCLEDLKDIGYQIGAGMMVGSPGQTDRHLAADLCYLQELSPHMVGIGPFITHHETPFAHEPSGSVDQTLYLLSIIRIMLPRVLLPATTALGTMDPMGREKGFLAGANVVMPNLSPVKNRKDYELYDNKIRTGDESAQCRDCLELRVRRAGCHLVTDRGDYCGFEM